MDNFGLQARKKQQGIRSDLDLASKLLARLPTRRGLPSRQSLATYLGNLGRGDSRWFRKRPEILQELCKLLETTESELIQPAEEEEETTWTFGDFPQLPPIDLMRECPPNLLANSQDLTDLFGIAEVGLASLRVPAPSTRGASGADGASRNTPRYTNWLDPRPHWIEALPGSGARLFAYWLATQRQAVCLPVRRLADAVGAPELQSTMQVLVLVAEPDPDGDAAAAVELGQARRVTVVASFQLPLGADANSSEDGTRSQSDEQGTWTRVPWQLSPDWRRRFLQWIADRLKLGNPASFVEGILGWLAQFDPLGRRYPTPGDLMPILALVHEHGLRWLRQQTPDQLSLRLLEALVANLPEDSDGKLWLKAQAPPVLRALLHRRLCDHSAPLRGGSPAATWAEYMPTELLSTRLSEPSATAGIRRLRRLKSKARERAEVELVARITTPNPLEAVEFLRRATILRVEPSGFLTIYPRFTQEQILHALALHATQHDSPEKWGRWATEPLRRELLDWALDQQDERGLQSCIERALAIAETRSLGAVGAIESLFAAIGRRLQDGWRPREPARVAQLHALWRCAEATRTTRVDRSHAIRVPCTRIDGYWSQTGSFIATCWAWSFNLPPPTESRGADPAWLWPGWEPVSVNHLADIPYSTRQPSSVWVQRGQFASAEDRLFPLFDRFLARCPDTDLPKFSGGSAAFMVHVLLHAAERGWPLDVLNREIWRTWQTAILLREAPRLSAGARSWISSWLLACFQRSSSIGQALLQLESKDPPLHRFIVDNADWQQVAKQLSSLSPEVLLRDSAGFPVSLRPWLVEHLVMHPDLPAAQIEESLLQPQPGIDLQAVLDLVIEIAARRSDYTFNLPRALYQRSLPDALRAAARAWRKEADAAATQNWFIEAPDSIAARAPLIDILGEVPPAERPAWTRGFLAATLHYAGPLTERVFRLLQGQE